MEKPNIAFSDFFYYYDGLDSNVIDGFYEMYNKISEYANTFIIFKCSPRARSSIYKFLSKSPLKITYSLIYKDGVMYYGKHIQPSYSSCNLFFVDNDTDKNVLLKKFKIHVMIDNDKSNVEMPIVYSSDKLPIKSFVSDNLYEIYEFISDKYDYRKFKLYSSDFPPLKK